MILPEAQRATTAAACHTGVVNDVVEASGAAGGAFHVLAKPTGAACNLDCAYCFFLEKERLYPGVRSRMTDQVLERYVRQLFEAQRSPEVTIAWQGGEPTLMGLEFFRRAVACAQRYAPPGTTVSHTIQTNGTRLNGDWAAFLRRARLSGRPEHRRAARAARPLPPRQGRQADVRPRHAWPRPPAGARRLVERPHGGARRERRRPGQRLPLPARRVRGDVIQFIPIVERPSRDGVPYGDAVTERSVTAEQWGRFLAGVFDEWVRRDVGEVYVQMFDAALANWYGEPPGLCVHAPTCGTALALEFNGDVYSCDHFVDPEHLLGNIGEQHLGALADSAGAAALRARQARRAARLLSRLRRARRMPRRLSQRPFVAAPDGEPGLNYLCAGYKAFFAHVDEPMRAMCALLRAGRAPSEIVDRKRTVAPLPPVAH